MRIVLLLVALTRIAAADDATICKEKHEPKACYAAALEADDHGDLVLGAKLYLVACNGGVLAGCTNLGVDYLRGMGVAKDAAKGIALYKKACTMRSTPPRCANLGTIYQDGKSAPQDLKKANALYEKACANGSHLRRCAILAQNTDDGVGVAASTRSRPRSCSRGRAISAAPRRATAPPAATPPEPPGRATSSALRSSTGPAATARISTRARTSGQLYIDGNGVAKRMRSRPTICSSRPAITTPRSPASSSRTATRRAAASPSTSSAPRRCTPAHAISASRSAARCPGSTTSRAPAVPKDAMPHAEKLYEKACDHKDALGCGSLGSLYRRGATGVPADPAKARTFLQGQGCDGAKTGRLQGARAAEVVMVQQSSM